MRRLLLLLATSLPILHATAQDGLWSPVSKSNVQSYLNGRAAVSPLPTNYELVKLNRSRMQQLQQQAPLVKLGVRSSASPVRVSLPLPVNGQNLVELLYRITCIIRCACTTTYRFQYL